MEQVPPEERRRRDAISRAHKARGTRPPRSRHALLLNITAFEDLVKDMGAIRANGLAGDATVAEMFEVGVGTIHAARKGGRITDALVSAVMKQVRGLSSYSYEDLFIEANVAPVAA